jgi:hypothetical protein
MMSLRWLWRAKPPSGIRIKSMWPHHDISYECVKKKEVYVWHEDWGLEPTFHRDRITLYRYGGGGRGAFLTKGLGSR